jgi:tRNA dimethylallyltransferase
MDLGTGKDYGDYIIYDSSIPVHLIDIHDAGYKYNLYEFQKDFFRVYEVECMKKYSIVGNIL